MIFPVMEHIHQSRLETRLASFIPIWNVSGIPPGTRLILPFHRLQNLLTTAGRDPP